MKKYFTLVVVMIAVGFSSVFAESRKEVGFPFGLTGHETLEQCGEILSGIFGEGKMEDSEKFDIYAIDCDYLFYNMTAYGVFAMRQKDSDDRVNLLTIRLKDKADLNGCNNLLDIFLFAVDNYGNRYNSDPVRKQIDINGNQRRYTFSEEIDQLMEAIEKQQLFEYKSDWFTPTDNNNVIFIITVTGKGGNEFYTSLSWSSF